MIHDTFTLERTSDTSVGRPSSSARATSAFVAKGKSAQLVYTEQSVFFDTKHGPASRKQGTEELLEQLNRAV